MNYLEETAKVRVNHDLAKASAQALQLEEQAIHEIENIVAGIKSGAFISLDAHAALATAVKTLSTLNTDLQSAVPFVPPPAPPVLNPAPAQLNTRLDSTHNQPLPVVNRPGVNQPQTPFVARATPAPLNTQNPPKP